MIATILLGLWLVMAVAPSTPIAAALRAAMVERPAAWMSRMTRGHIVLIIVAFLVAWVVTRWISGDMIAILGAGTPDIVAWALTFDIATYVDVAIAIVLTSSSLRLRGGLSRIVTAIRRPAARYRRARKRRRLSRPAPANDDEDQGMRIAA